MERERVSNSSEITLSLLEALREIRTLNSSYKYITDLGQSHSKSCELDNGTFKRKDECLSTKISSGYTSTP